MQDASEYVAFLTFKFHEANKGQSWGEVEKL